MPDNSGDLRAMRFLQNHLRAYDHVLPGRGSWESARIKELVRTMAERSEDDRKEASKLMVDVSKVAVALGSGAIAVNGSFLKDERVGDTRFWLFLASITLFVGAIGTALIVITRTIERAGGDRGALAWEYAQERGLLQASSVFGFLGIVAFVIGTALN